MKDKYMPIAAGQIEILIKQGCRAENWNDVCVSSGFTPENIYNCRFEGRVMINDNVRLFDSKIRNYTICDGATVDSVRELSCDGVTRFGNGVNVAAVNENGGRSVPIYEALNAQLAYIMAMYRNRTKLIDNLCSMIDDFARERESNMGLVGTASRLENCGRVHNVRVGRGAHLQGVSSLVNGTVVSSAEAPTYIGTDVKMRDFIVTYGARIDNGATMERCFVGEACKVDYGFTAVDSLFFANCDVANGEACSVFAAPYTVSHHKSSLLIAGYFGFFNAGSGSNQSNHLFKAGAIHQAIHERGCKYGSNAYIMAPARTGAFNVVLGRHTSHHDSSRFPYSYLIAGEDGKTNLLPGMSLRSHGTERDLQKWPKRDNRKGAKLDKIHFDEYNPYVGQQLLEAIKSSEELLAKGQIQDYTYERMRIRQSSLRRGLELYRSALNATIGAILKQGDDNTDATCRGRWVDMAGMYAPWEEVDRMLKNVEEGKYMLIAQFELELMRINGSYRGNAYGWAMAQLEERLGHETAKRDVSAAIIQGELEAAKLTVMRSKDRDKEYSELMRIGYGVDSEDAEGKKRDFEAVQGLNK